MTGTLRILDHTGDTKVEWDILDPASVAEVKAKFDQVLAESRGLAYRTDANGGNAEKITEFDESAPQIIISPQLVGG